MEKLNDEQRKLIEDNYNLIYYFYSRYFGSMLNNEEYNGIAHEALCRAALNYNSEKGKFGTCLYWQLKSAISRHFRESNRNKRKLNQSTISLETYIYELNGLKISDTISDFNDTISDVIEKSYWDEILKKQSKKKQLIVKLKLLGYNQSEVAKIIGMTQQGVRSQLMTLKKQIERQK